MVGRPVASFVIPVKSRKQHLLEALPYVLNQDVDVPYEVVVVDYDCPERSGQSVLSAFKGLRVLEVSKVAGFNLSHARNIGGVRTLGRVICFSDADSKPHKTWLANVLREIDRGMDIATAKPMAEDLGGTIAVRSTMFHTVRGYDEKMDGWGFEDSDFHRRVLLAGGLQGQYAPELVGKIYHGAGIRTAFYGPKNLRASYRVNKRRSDEHPFRLVNPNGYGSARLRETQS